MGILGELDDGVYLSCETFTTPELVTTRRFNLGPPALVRPGPSDDDDDEAAGDDDDDKCLPPRTVGSDHQ